MRRWSSGCLIGAALVAATAGLAPAGAVSAQNAPRATAAESCKVTPGPMRDLIIPSLFFNPSQSLLFSVFLGCNQPTTGQFDLNVKGKGNYKGAVPVSPQGTHLDRLHGTVKAQYLPLNGRGKPRTVLLRMDGYVDPRLRMAALTVTADGAIYRLLTPHGSATAAAAAVDKTIVNLRAKNWTALYQSLTLDLMGTYSQAQYARMMAAGPVFVTITKSGAATLATDHYGYSYYRQPVTIRARTRDGRLMAEKRSIPLLWDGIGAAATWRFAVAQPLSSR